MTLGGGYYGGRRRGRPPVLRRVVAWMLALLLVVLAGIYAYRTGSALATQEAAALRLELSELSDAVTRLEQENIGLNQQLQSEQRRNLELVEQYRRDVPDDAMLRLVTAARARLEAGVPQDRLEEVVAGILPEWQCEGEPVTRRFVIRTPTTPGGNDAVGFAGGEITVTGTGVSSLNDQGQPLAWFNPAEPVTLMFARLGGDATDITGVLPLHHAVIVDDTIHRFSVLAGERSFVNVTGIVCAYP